MAKKARTDSVLRDIEQSLRGMVSVEDTRTRIVRSAMKAVRQYGLEGVRIQNISDLAELTPGALYRYFNSKDDLMKACFFHVDRQVAALYDHFELDPILLVSDPAAAVKKLWLPYYRFWIAHPDETVFYHRFMDSAKFPEFNKRRDISYFAAFDGMVSRFLRMLPGLNRLNHHLLWLQVLTGTVVHAKYVVEGVLPNTAETEEEIFQLMMFGLSAYLKPS